MGVFLEISTPEGVILEKEVDSVVVPTTLGATGILPGHVPLAAKVVPGILHFDCGCHRESVVVDSGFLLLQSNFLSVIVDAAVDVVNIDPQEAEQARKRAEEALATANTATLDKGEIAQLEAKIRYQVTKQRARNR